MRVRYLFLNSYQVVIFEVSIHSATGSKSHVIIRESIICPIYQEFKLRLFTSSQMIVEDTRMMIYPIYKVSMAYRIWRELEIIPILGNLVRIN